MSRQSFLLTLLLAVAVPAAAQVGAPAAPTALPAQLSAADIRSVVDNLSAAAEQRYVDPAAGKRMAGALRSKAAAGAYDRLTDPVELAVRLSADLYAAVPDVHLRVAYEPNRSAETLRQGTTGRQVGGAQPFARIDPRSANAIARSNFGFETVQRLDGNIGYLKLNQFVIPDMSEPTARAALAFLSSSDAIIIDLRGNIGGSPELVRYILSHFTAPAPVALMTRYIRDDDRTETMMTLGEVPGKRRHGTPLHVLIDRNSASSAEMFAYLVQQKRLGTVYGEISRGAGQGGNMIPVGHGLSAFIPFTRIVDGPGWEGTGIRPDVAASSADALGAAHRAALRQLVAATSNAEIRREREWALEMAEAAAQPPIGSADLARFEGQFASRAFKARQGTLYVIGASGREDALVRISDTVFRSTGGRYSFDFAGQQLAAKVVFESIGGTRSETVRQNERATAPAAPSSGSIRI
ncbi:S41 family peptidase [Sphingomonas xanthus]|nr:S41 family peptidase [Sphingomonas xanthus]